MSKVITLGAKSFSMTESDGGRSVFQETGVPFDQRQILIVTVKAPTTKRRSFIASTQLVTPVLDAEGFVVAKAYDSRERTIPVSMTESSSAAIAVQAELAYVDADIVNALTKMLPII